MKVSVSESILLLRELTSQGLNPFLVLYPTLYEEFLLEVSEKEFDLSNQLLSYLSTFEHWQMKTFKFHDLERKEKKLVLQGCFQLVWNKIRETNGPFQ